jgi:predicted small integral membrane protein
MFTSLPPDWMRWTIPSMIFLGSIISMLITLTVWDMKDPGWGRVGTILPIETTRGDRVFMTLLLTGITFCLWLYFVGQSAAWTVLLIGAALAVVVLRYF